MRSPESWNCHSRRAMLIGHLHHIYVGWSPIDAESQPLGDKNLLPYSIPFLSCAHCFCKEDQALAIL